ncbi:nitric-oxide reductase large subunit [Corynebacterium diphtheriae]|nr:nitric-oxide reductase large subunit [Corynebacterium diphtheriae]
MGQQINIHKPPIPERVQTIQGQVLFTKDDIVHGQQVWQSIGGQQIGSVWGHGSYVAPDWTADWLHREATIMLDSWAQEQGHEHYSDLPAEQQAALKERLKKTDAL